MKNYLRKFLLLIITTCYAFLLTNCSLDENLYGVATTDRFIQTENDARFVVNGVYGTFQTFNSFKSSTAGLVLYSGDDFASSQISQSNSAGVWLNRLFTSSNKYVQYAWSSFYDAINRANSAKEAVAGSESLSLEFKHRIDGEMTFVRGFSYYYLVRLFGGVPLWLTAAKSGESFYKPRENVDDVYAQIFSDLKNANEKCLPFSQQPEKEFGRATKGSAQAILSQAYLTYANYLDLSNRSSESAKYYQEAVNWADSVLLSGEYILLDNYADLYEVSKERTAYKEVIFGIQFTRDNTAASANSKGSEWAYYTQPRTRRNICGNVSYGLGNGNLKLQPWFVEQYFTGEYNGDYRSEVSFLTSWDGYTTAGLARKYITFPVIAPNATDLIRESQTYLNKYKDPDGIDIRNNENDLYIIRLSEIYLIKAEALNELGNQTDAYIAFNKVRERARKANGTPRMTPVDLTSGLSKDEFRMAVFNERGLELVGEGQRFFDAVRTRYMNTNVTMLQWRMETYYPGLPADQKALPSWHSSSQTWRGGRVYMLNVSEWNERFLLYPIPTSELDANPNFGAKYPRQNPGW